MIKSLEISWLSLWRVLFMLIFAVALYYLREVFVILFLALIISSALDMPISYMERKKIPRILGALITFIFVLGLLAFLLYIIVPAAISEFSTAFTKMEKSSASALWSFGAPKELVRNFERNFGSLADALFAGSASFFDLVSSIFGGVVFMISVFILSFYLSINRDGVEKFLRAVLPLAWEEYAVDIYLRVRRKMGLWLQGQMLLSLVVGIATFLGLLILDVDFSLVLGIMAGLLEMVPIVGPVFTGVLAFLVAISDSWTLGISVIILFAVIQQMESHLLVPVVMRKTTGLHPVVVVISLLAGSQLGGFIGLILAVPSAVIIQEFIEDWAARKRNGKNV
ncbi:MAG: AI-2E family transporter [Patescibacteria group bacterium]